MNTMNTKEQLLKESISLLREVQMEMHGGSEVHLASKIDEVIAQLEQIAESDLDKIDWSETIRMISKALGLVSIAKGLHELWKELQ